MDFTKHTVQAYLFWHKINNITDIMDWEDTINLLIFADYAGCDDFIRYFVRNILPAILNEPNTCYARYLLSIRRNSDYIKTVEEHDDEWNNSWECKELQKIDETEDHSDDNVLTHIKFDELIWLFPRLSFSSRQRLARLFPTAHSYGKRLREMLVKYCYVMHKGGIKKSYTPIITNKGVMIPYRRKPRKIFDE